MQDSSDDKEILKLRILSAVLFFIFLFVFLLNVPRIRYVANLKTGKFHRIECRYGTRILPRQRKYFTRIEDIIDQKFIPCRECNPLE